MINEPLEIKMRVPNGNYEARVTVKSHCDTVFSVLSQSRRFMAQNVEIKNGCEKEIVFNLNVCDTNKRDIGFEEAKEAEIYIMSDGDLTVTAALSPVDVPTIYIAGDSTVTDQPAVYPYNPHSTYCGWGQMFPQFLKTGIAVSNHAQSGASTRDFIENNWTAFKDKIKAGDYLIVEFGHNDQKIEELDAFGGYAENLRYFVNFARERGANPILCSPINRIIFEEDGTLLNLLGEYRGAVKAVAEEMNVPFIDLWLRTTEYFETAGPVKSWSFFWGDGENRDYTHTNDIGGNLVARFAAREMAENSALADFIKTEMLEITPIFADKSDKPDNADAFKHIKTIGLVNAPDIDNDITNI